MRILLVDDNEETLEIVREIVRFRGHDPVTATDANTAWRLYNEEPFPLVITDLKMPGEMDGFGLLQKIHGSDIGSRTDVVIVSAHGDMDSAVQIMRAGAYDFLSKPINAQELASVIERSAEHQELLEENRRLTEQFDDQVRKATQVIRRDVEEMRQRVRQAFGLGEVVAESPAMRQILAECRRYHENPSVPVLIEGETGTGKEVVARMIHFGATGADSPFVDVNCSALPRDLFESELFGYEKGAFTGGAQRGASGKFKAAGQGTLLLDEIGEIPLHMQPKLLRVVQERTYYQVGGTKKHRFDARLICSTNRDLQHMVDGGTFRLDLYHRIAVGRIRIPPLRERVDDIAPMARAFLIRESKQKKKRFVTLDEDTIDLLLSHSWPGNVRELENAIERAVLEFDGESLKPEHLSSLASVPVMQALSDHHPSQLNPEQFTLPDTGLDLEAFYTKIVCKALDKFNGNKSQAAEYLGISRFAIKRRLDKS